MERTGFDDFHSTRTIAPVQYLLCVIAIGLLVKDRVLTGSPFIFTHTVSSQNLPMQISHIFVMVFSFFSTQCVTFVSML